MQVRDTCIILATGIVYILTPSVPPFLSGEIGPVGDTTYMHGFTMVAAILKARNLRPSTNEEAGEDGL